MIKVFKTDIDSPDHADLVKNSLLMKFPGFRIDFDLEDSDRILRVEGDFFRAEEISGCLKEHGFICVDLPIDLSFDI